MSERQDPHRIGSEAALREVIGETKPGLALKVTAKLGDIETDFLSKCPFLILSTADAEGRIDASPKGDAPGFVLIENESTIVIPDRPGNKLAYGHLNILSNPQVGVLCMVPGTSETLRLNGRAELTRDPELLDKLAARGRPAVLAIRVDLEEVFFHCAKAFIRSDLWKPDSWPENYRVSLGAVMAAILGAEKEVAGQIDEAVETDYRDGL